MNIKDSIFYKLTKYAYISYIHCICDAKRTPLINKLKISLLSISGGGTRYQPMTYPLLAPTALQVE